MTTVVVDASVAVKWVLAETGSVEARALGQTGADLIAPELVLIEVGNVLWKSVRLKRITAVDAERAFDALPSAFTRIEPLTPLLRRGLALAIALDHPVYDCLYLALAEREAAPIVTTDARLLAIGPKLQGVRLMPLMP